MANLYYDVRLDIQKDVVIDSGLRFTQGDSKVIYLRLAVMNGGVPFDASNTTPTVNFVKPDGTYVVGTPVETGDFWIYQFLGNELQSAGKVLCDIKFTYESGRVSSSKFTFIVEKDTTMTGASASSSYIAPMEELLNEMKNYRNQGYSIVEASESWAQGGTGTREDEDVNNSKYWAEQAKESAETIARVYKYKGSVPTYNDLPLTQQEIGDVWNVIDTGMNYAWDGQDWDALGGASDWSDLTNKPFESIDENTLEVVDDVLVAKSEIDDTAKGIGSTWSSEKIKNEIDNINLDVLGVSNGDLENSADGNIRSLKLVGEGHKSKNLIPFPYANDKRDIGGLKAETDENGIVTVSGTQTSAATPFHFNEASVSGVLPLDKNKTYAFLNPLKSDIRGQITLGIRWFTDTDVISGTTGTNTSIGNHGDANGTVIRSGFSYAYIYMYSYATSKTFTNLKFAPMLVEVADDGTYPTEYEPYGLITSEGIVESASKNFWNQELGNYISGAPDRATDVWRTKDYIPCNEGEKYSFSVDGVINRIVCISFDTNKNWIRDLVFADGIIVIPSGVAYIKARTYGADFSKVQNGNAMLAKGEDAEFVPYAKTTINASEILSSTFTAVNDIKDELIVNADGTGKFIKRVGKISEFTKRVSTNTSGEYRFRIEGIAKPTPNSIIGNIICNLCNANTASMLYARTEGVSIDSDGNVDIFLEATKSMSLADFNSYALANKLFAIYELATPTETDLTPQQVSALLSLKTYDGYTRITSDCEHEISYYTEFGKAIGDIDVKVNEVQGIVADNADWLKSKNLFNELQAKIGIAWNLSSNSARAIVNVEVKPNTTYTISFKSLGGVDMALYYEKENADVTTQIKSSGFSATTTITTSENTHCLTIQFNKTSISLADIVACGIQVENGSISTPYAPYSKSNVELTNEIADLIATLKSKGVIE